MNAKSIFSIFVFFVILIACTNVAFASENIDDSKFSEESDLDEVDSDLDDLNDDSDLGDSSLDEFDDDSDLEDVDDSDFEDYDMENYDFKHNLLNLNITYKACSSRLGATSNLNNHSVNETKKDSNPNTESIEHAKKAKSVLKSINLPSENQSNYDKNISGNNNEKSNNEENKQGNNYLTIISIILVLILVIIACKKLY
ncbi:MAG: hypothetical protein MJ226_04145 [archaeon]|nr:hypothetical protein [archaeon]